MPRCWLFKSEPDCFSIHDLAAAPQQTTFWDGVRNYQARNFLRDDIQPGDRVLYYHSSADPPAVVGVARVTRAGYPDHTARDQQADHFDPRATADNPIWFMVDIRLERIFASPLPLEQLRGSPALAGMELLKRGSRLSVQPVSQPHFDTILALAEQSAAPTVGDQPAPTRRRATPKTAATGRARSSATRVAATARRVSKEKVGSHGGASAKNTSPRRSAN